jgi:hypothetical protein
VVRASAGSAGATRRCSKAAASSPSLCAPSSRDRRQRAAWGRAEQHMRIRSTRRGRAMGAGSCNDETPCVGPDDRRVWTPRRGRPPPLARHPEGQRWVSPVGLPGSLTRSPGGGLTCSHCVWTPCTSRTVQHARAVEAAGNPYRELGGESPQPRHWPIGGLVKNAIYWLRWVCLLRACL